MSDKKSEVIDKKSEIYDKKAFISLRTIESKVALCIAGWYVISLVTLWTNRYVLSKLQVDSNLLSLAQLSMSVIGGLGWEVYVVGWTVCKRGLRKMLNNGLKDMLLLASVRILTVLFGLTALKYIAVSFTQTIKSSAPFFTVLLTYFLLGQRTGWRINFSLTPIVTGLIFCSFSDNSFHVIGFVAALMSNCVDCIQNVLTKKLLNRSYSTSQLQLYSSMFAVIMQLVFIIYNWVVSPLDPILESSKTNCSVSFIALVLILDGACFFIQCALAYMLMSMVSPVTHSVANCVKRALIIVLSIYRYGDDVTLMNWCGMILVIVGVYGFNAASRIEREEAAKDSVIGLSTKDPVIGHSSVTLIPTSTIHALSEIRIEKGQKVKL